MPKRDDLQWLRALAIIAVVSFHLEPKIFPFGYLGVDIFFVISGYLMTSILSKEEDTLKFYSRRIKRIFPVYFLIITIFFGIGYFELLPSHFDFLKTEVLFSIFFANNFPSIFEKKEYFQMISEYKFLLHTWSLSAEIQFYLIAPYLIKFILSKNRSLHWTSALIILSWMLQILITNNAMAFGLVFCRIWQFLVGTFAFLYSNNNHNLGGYFLLDQIDVTNESIKNDNNQRFYLLNFLTFFLLVLTCFMPSRLSSDLFAMYFVRLFITLLTGTSILLNSWDAFKMPYFINTVFVYIGDISYVVYLIHWPLIVFFKYFHIALGDSFIILCIFASTLFIHECFEKPFGKLSLLYNNSVTVIFCSIILILLVLKSGKVSTTFSLIQQNEEEANSCKHFYYNNCESSPIIEKYLTSRPKHDFMDVYCSFKFNPKSNKTILITGNSFVYFQIRGISEAIKNSKMQFSEVFVVEHPQCNLLVGNLNNFYKNCIGLEKSHDLLLDKLRPDVIIHSARMDQFITSQVSTNINFTDDENYEEIKRQILHVANFTQRLIIIEPHPPFIRNQLFDPLIVAHAIFTNTTTEQFSISSKEFHRRHDPSWNRVKEAVKHCKNCVLVPTENIMCPSETCPMVDPISRLSVFCDPNHITPRQSLRFIPHILKALND